MLVMPTTADAAAAGTTVQKQQGRLYQKGTPAERSSGTVPANQQQQGNKSIAWIDIRNTRAVAVAKTKQKSQTPGWRPATAGMS